MKQKNLPKISAIIPVYGAEEHLCACIDSVLSQSYQNFELLLIDDESPDNSGAICDRYVEKDSRIKVFHRSHQGVSGSRNFGIQQARGEYIAFIDADDLVQPCYMEKLYEAIVSDDKNSIAICAMQYLVGETLAAKQEPLSDYQREKDSVYSQYLEPIITRKIHGSSCRILYPTQLLRKYQIVFSDCKIAEDQLFLIEVISHCRNIWVCKEPLYLYRQNEQSASHSNYITNYIPDRTCYLKKLKQILDNLPLEQEQRQWLLSFAFQFCRMLVYMNATASLDVQSELTQIDSSLFGRYSIPKDQERRFSFLMGGKHKILNFLVKHRMFLLIGMIRRYKTNGRGSCSAKAA